MNKRDKIQMYIIFSIITLIFNIGLSVFGNVFSKVEEAASIEYVDTEVKEVKEYVDSSNNDQNFNNSKEHNEMKVETNKKASNEKVDAMLMSLDRVIIQNDKLYLFLLEKGK